MHLRRPQASRAEPLKLPAARLRDAGFDGHAVTPTGEVRDGVLHRACSRSVGSIPHVHVPVPAPRVKESRPGSTCSRPSMFGIFMARRRRGSRGGPARHLIPLWHLIRLTYTTRRSPPGSLAHCRPRHCRSKIIRGAVFDNHLINPSITLPCSQSREVLSLQDGQNP